MSFEISLDENLGVYIISVVSDTDKGAEKIKKKLLEQLGLEEIVTTKTVEIQVIAKPKITRKTQRPSLIT